MKAGGVSVFALQLAAVPSTRVPGVLHRPGGGGGSADPHRRSQQP